MLVPIGKQLIGGFKMSELALFNVNGVLFLLRWMHVFFGVVWIGHLYYFNFVQGAFFAETDANTKSNAIQKLVPRALWWFRWGAMWTLVTGLTYLMIRAHLGGMEMFRSSWGITIMTGMSLGILMWFNVWFVIWPNQKIVIENATLTAQGKPGIAGAADRAARAGVASRYNVLFSLPMLFFMTGARHLPLAVSDTYKFGTYAAVTAVILIALEINALKGKTGPLTTVKGVIHCGAALTLVFYVLMEVLK